MNSVVLDVVIGLVFIYLLYSLLASVIQEIIATALAFRSKILVKSIVRMLQDEDENNYKVFKASIARLKSWTQVLLKIKIIKENSLADLFYQHPLLKYLGEDQWFSKPAYLTAKNFSKVIIDLLRGENAEPGANFAIEIQNALNLKILKYNNSEYRIDDNTAQYLKTLWTDASGDVQKFTIQLENWFDETQARATGWYKQYTQVILFLIGLSIAIIFNVDTIQIVKQLSSDPKLREQLVNQAEAFVKDHPNLDEQMAKAKANPQFSADSTKIEELIKKRDSLRAQVDNLIQGDIKKLNSVLAIGWQYSELPDSLRLADTLAKDSIAKLKGFQYNRIVIKNDSLIQKNDTIKLVYYEASNFDRVINLLKKDDKDKYQTLDKAGTFVKVHNYFFEPYCYMLRDFKKSWILGWILTAIAISLGAPFWFDLLNKLFKLRGNSNTDIKKEEKEKASSNTVSPLNVKG